MLAEAILATYDRPKTDRHGFSVTSVSLCPYATYLNYTGKDKAARTAQEYLRMDDGHYQEAEILDQLKKAGFILKYTGKDQMRVTVGGSISGRPDGLIKIDTKFDLLEIKAMSLERFTRLRQKGLSAFPGYKCQVQLYMASEELRDIVEGCRFIAKHKDTCRLFDIYEEKDLNFSDSIIEEVSKIVNGVVPEKPEEPFKLCVGCSHRTSCWQATLTDMSGIKSVSLPEAAAKWKEGKFHRDYGKELISTARETLIEELGDKDLLLCEDLRVRRITSKSFTIDIGKFVEVFGANRLPEVGVEKIKEQIRIGEA